MSNPTPMKVYVAPEPKGLSQAMYRVYKALARHVVEGIEITHSADLADLQVLHGIGSNAKEYLVRDGIPYVVIQYCYKSAGTLAHLKEIWDDSVMVWSYYDIGDRVAPTPFYFAPLGVDGCFINRELDRDIGVITSGYVDGYGAEAISAVAQAAHIAGISCVHLGPRQEQFGDLPGDWSNVNGISDEELAALYSRAQWVSGLRYIEGFELPIIEGLACGARPIAFDRPDMHMWYDGLAEFVKETKDHGKLVTNLASLFRKGPRPVGADEYSTLAHDFSWSTIAKGFWEGVTQACVIKGLKGNWEDFGEGTSVLLHGEVAL